MSLGDQSVGFASLGGDQVPLLGSELPGVTYIYADGIATITLSLTGAGNLDATSLADTTVRLSMLGDGEVIGPNGDALRANIWVPQDPAAPPVWTPQPTIPGGTV